MEAAGPGLGTAMAISGAGINPSSGRYTSKPVAFLTSILSLRLGWWLGNPRREAPSARPGPRNALLSLLSELFAQSSARSRYLNVSDGGRFENLGLYELGRRARLPAPGTRCSPCSPNCSRNPAPVAVT